jgi:aspartate/methionine/tyrosine aminotransferase
MEFSQLATKYNAANFCSQTPTIGPPKFLLENFARTVIEPHNNQYTMHTGHPQLREKISEHYTYLLKSCMPYGSGPLNPNSEVLVTSGA